MVSKIERRETAITLMANHVLSNGLAGATLRPLAAAAGTSDRMLLYHFADKDELMTAVLKNIAARLLRELDDVIPIGPPRQFALLLEQVWVLLGSERLKPYMNVWLDLTSGAAHGMKSYRDVAGTMADTYLNWVTSRLETQDNDALSGSAAVFLVSIQGMYMLNATGRPEIVKSAMGHFRSTLLPHRDEK